MKEILREAGAKTEWKIGKVECRAEAEEEKQRGGGIFSEECSISYLQTGQKDVRLPGDDPQLVLSARLIHTDVCARSHDRLLEYIHMHSCTLKRENVFFFSFFPALLLFMCFLLI